MIMVWNNTAWILLQGQINLRPLVKNELWDGFIMFYLEPLY